MLHLIACVRTESYTPIERYRDEAVLFEDIAAGLAFPARWRENSLATSIFTWSGKTPKANIPRSAPGMQKYIRFFSQMILVFGLLYPVLGWMGESDAFLEKIEYQSFLQKMEEVQSDAEKITYLDNDHLFPCHINSSSLEIHCQ